MTTQTATSNESVVFEGLTDLLRKCVISPIVDHFASKGVQTSVEELSGVLKLPSHPPLPSATGIPPVSTAPPSLAGLPGFGMPTSSGRRGSRKTSETALSDNERCRYVFTRGRNKDQRCNARVEPGQPFCSGCKNKKSAQQQLQNSSGSSMGQFPGQMMPQVPNLGSTPLPTVPGLNTAPTQEEFRIHGIQLGDGMYYDRDHKIVLKSMGEPNKFICCGIYDPQTNKISALTPEKIELCKRHRIPYVDPNAPEQKVSVNEIPKVPLPTDMNALGEPDDEEDDV